MSDTMSLDMELDEVHTPGYEPATPSQASPEAEQQALKKKRKAWGQQIPDYKEVIGPRKRAKTAEEKEQRKNERILRNRKAADKSRQRQKAAVADLEEKKSRIEQENAALRHALSQYQAKFGVLPHVPFPALDTQIYPSPSESYLDNEPETKCHLSTASYDTPQTPALSYDSPMIVPKQESPALAPTLFLSHEELTNDLSNYDDLNPLGDFNETGLTQYPAAILCDPQCQPLSAKFQAQQLNLSLALFQLMIVTTTLTTFSLSTLYPLMEVFRTLVTTLSTPFMEQGFLNNSLNFTLIHGLISTPSTPTNPQGLFRMKLLSRLLACSPRMARLLLAATQQALQRVLDEDNFAEDPQARWMWASLMTMKWAVIRLEREHMRVRLGELQGPETELALSGDTQMGAMYFKMQGVDYQAVERSSGRYKDFKQEVPDMGSHLVVDNARAQVAEVH